MIVLVRIHFKVQEWAMRDCYLIFEFIGCVLFCLVFSSLFLVFSFISYTTLHLIIEFMLYLFELLS
jgi:hypothetical protein